MGAGYFYSPLDNDEEPREDRAEEPHRDNVRDDSPTMTRRAAVGIIAREWGGRAVGLVLTVGIILALVCALFLWRSDIYALLKARPSRAELLVLGIILFMYRRAPRDIRRWARRETKKAASLRVERERALKTAWAVLRPPRPRGNAGQPQPSDVEVHRGS
jgi:hypothetical protein